MKQVIQTILIATLCLLVGFSIQAIDPPSGGGSATTCNTGTGGAQRLGLIKDGSNLRPGSGSNTCRAGGGNGSDKCYDLRTGAEIPCTYVVENGERLTTIVSQNLGEDPRFISAEDLPIAITVTAILERGGNLPAEEFTYVLGGSQIYENYDFETGAAWTEINLPWVFDFDDLRYLDATYQITYNIAADIIVDPKFGTVETFNTSTTQTLTFEEITINGESFVKTVYDNTIPWDFIENFEVFPNPTTIEKPLSFRFLARASSSTTTAVLYLHDQEGNLLTTEEMQGARELDEYGASVTFYYHTVDLSNLCLRNCLSGSLLFYQVVVTDNATGLTGTESGKILMK